MNTQRQSCLVRSIAHETEEEIRKSLGHGNCSKALCDKEKEMNSGCSGQARLVSLDRY